MTDPRRDVPRTDVLLAHPAVAAAMERHPRHVVKAAVVAAQEAVRRGEVSPADAAAAAIAALPSGLRGVINATGVVLHTNLGRAPLSPEAAAAAAAAGASYVDVELDLASGRRAPRGLAAEAALRAVVPEAAAAVVLNNGAAALVLAALALAPGAPVAVSRGELVEIGDGFRLTSILGSAGARLAEVGATNRTTLDDYRAAVAAGAVAILKVHPSNFAMTGFTSAVSTRALASVGVPVVVDVGSGLLRPDPLLPDEPDVATALQHGATVVTCSGDKLLGGPQAGIAVGEMSAIARMRRHPLARAFRVDKMTLAALTATLAGPPPPVWQMLRSGDLMERAQSLEARLPGTRAVATRTPVGGGSGPGVELDGAALSCEDSLAEVLRRGTPPVVGRVHRGRLLLDLRSVPRERDDDLAAAVLAALAAAR